MEMIYEDRIEKLEDLIKIQTMPGNYDYDPYMHGMANGMLCALAVLTRQEPKYLDAPERWLRDSNLPNEPTIAYEAPCLT